MPPRRFHGRIVFLDRAEGAFNAKGLLDGVWIGRKGVRRYLRSAKHAGAKIGQERAAVLAVPLADAPGSDRLAGTRQRQEHILIAELGGVGRLQLPLFLRNKTPRLV